jgi:hypothetical protein
MPDGALSLLLLWEVTNPIVVRVDLHANKRLSSHGEREWTTKIIDITLEDYVVGWLACEQGAPVTNLICIFLSRSYTWLQKPRHYPTRWHLWDSRTWLHTMVYTLFSSHFVCLHVYSYHHLLYPPRDRRCRRALVSHKTSYYVSWTQQRLAHRRHAIYR